MQNGGAVTGQSFLTSLFSGLGRVVRVALGSLGEFLRSLAAPRPPRCLSDPSEDCPSLLGPNFRTVYRDALAQAAATEKRAESQ